MGVGGLRGKEVPKFRVVVTCDDLAIHLWPPTVIQVVTVREWNVVFQGLK